MNIVYFVKNLNLNYYLVIVDLKLMMEEMVSKIINIKIKLKHKNKIKIKK